MSYDFDTPVDRSGGDSYKWNAHNDRPDLLPMWVADMDFRTAPAIIEALRRRVDHGVFGYTSVGADYYDAVINWFSSRHGWVIGRSQIIYTSGVVPAVSAIIKAMTKPGDKIVTQTPAYNCFFSSIRNNGCRLVANELVRDPQTGRYTIDFDELDRITSDPDVTLMILCNPHNPTGRVWTPSELRRVGETCLRNGVFVIADEIHCELTFDGYEYTPYASISRELADNCAVCISPSKAFNTAGLQIANIVAGTPEIYRRIDRAINDNEVCDVNPFGVAATIAAYNESAVWLAELKQYIWENYQYLKVQLEQLAPDYQLTPLEGTYLAWMSIRPSGMNADQFCRQLLDATGLMLNPGEMYGQGGEEFVRLNLATQHSRIIDATERLTTFISRLHC
ncbi:MAG: pyridoxal phosphate-dependent aminotransferase [Paramuribaculum sp.]|nr:pyridoxal phosphate-dependent aminotransferase [Paramuribaculum sp.]